MHGRSTGYFARIPTQPPQREGRAFLGLIKESRPPRIVEGDERPAAYLLVKHVAGPTAPAERLCFGIGSMKRPFRQVKGDVLSLNERSLHDGEGGFQWNEES